MYVKMYSACDTDDIMYVHGLVSKATLSSIPGLGDASYLVIAMCYSLGQWFSVDMFRCVRHNLKHIIIGVIALRFVSASHSVKLG